MYGRRPLNELQLLTCPTCAAPQESPGSTVCELCGADLKRQSGRKPSRPGPLPRIVRSLWAPVRAATRVVTGVLSAALFVGRVATLLLLLASLVMGASLVPEVNALIPATKAVAVIARPWLHRAGDWASARLASWMSGPQRQPVATRSTIIPQKPAPVRFEATQAVLISSTPSGATVQVNARTMGKTPLTLRLAPGSYKVTISRPGYTTVSRIITVRQGSAESFDVKLTVEGPLPTKHPPRLDVPPVRSNGQHKQEDDDP